MSIDALHDHAARWFARDSLGTLTAEEQRALDAWLAADARHRLAYADVAAAAYATEQAAPAAAPVRRSARLAWLAGAAAVPALALVLLVLVPALRNVGADAYTAVGSVATRTLPDASTLRLDTDSAVRLAFDEHERVVELARGALDVDVAKDALRPFRVSCEYVHVTAVGTRFDVALRDGTVVVGVSEGSVQVRTDADPAGFALVAGERVAVDVSGRVTRSAAAAQAPAWTRGVLRFERMPLAEALREIDRYVPERIVSQADAHDTLVTAVFPLDDPHAALAALAQAHGLDVQRVPGLLYRLDEP